MRVAAVLLALALAPAPVADPILGSGHGLDHVMVWTGDADDTSAKLSDKLGFTVRTGGDFGDGIANRLIRFPDGTYLELLHLIRPRNQLEGDAADAADFLDAGPGANTFALETSDMDRAAETLRSRGLDLFPESPIVYDPDGPGPKPAQTSLFRTLFLKAPALRSGDLFLVSYARKVAASAAHANGAMGLTAVWLVTPDLRSDARRLETMGLRAERRVALPRLAAHGLVFAAGRGHVVLAAPDGRNGRAADWLKDHRGRIIALSLAVKDLDQARRLVERGYGIALPRYRGLWGEAFEAPSESDLGFAIEFHAARRPA